MSEDIKTQRRSPLAVDLQRMVRRFYPAGMRLKIEYDIDFGVDKRCGWSIAINGSYVVSLNKWLIIALIKALWAYQWWEKDNK